MVHFVRGLVGLAFLSLHIPTASSRLAARDGGGSGIPFTKTSAIGLTDSNDDLVYLVNITLGGQNFSVQLDTGSSDLWVYAPDADIKVTNDSHLTTNITYGIGSVSGPIQFAELIVGEFTIPSQAFVNVNKVGAGTLVEGIMGISFDSDTESRVEGTIHRSWGEGTTLGRTVLSSIFAQNSSLKPSYDISLSRAVDAEALESEGTFTIGTHDPDFAAVEQAPMISRVVNGMWTGYIDGMTVNGRSISFNQSVVRGTPSGKIVAVFDSGTSFNVMPGNLVDALYEDIQGSIKVNQTWYTPCHSGANVSFIVGGQTYAVNPLDLSLLQLVNGTLQDGTESQFLLCTASFQDEVITFGPDGIVIADLILGDAFLKNAYTSFNLGPTNREGDQSGSSGSYIQLLSLTNQDDAWADFQLTRSTAMSELPYVLDPVLLPAFFPSLFGAVEASSGTGLAGTPASSAAPQSSSTSAGNAAGGIADIDAAQPSGADSGVAATLDKYGPAIIGLLAANFAVMLLLCIIALVACTRGAIRRGARTRSLPSSYAPVSFRDKASTVDDAEDSATLRDYGDQ